MVANCWSGSKDFLHTCEVEGGREEDVRRERGGSEE